MQKVRSKNTQLTLKKYVSYIKENADIFKEDDWKKLTSIRFFKKLSYKFIKSYEEYWNWFYITEWIFISPKFALKFQHKIIWSIIFFNPNKKLVSQIPFETFKANAPLHHGGLWEGISCHQNLSIDFLREFEEYLNWISVSRHQKMDKEILREFWDKLYFNWLIHNNNLKKETIHEVYYENLKKNILCR